MKTAIVHDWLVSSVGGGEKVLEAIHGLFPSPIYTLLSNQEKLKNSYFQNLEIRSSFIQKLPFAESKFRSYLPLFPLAIEQFDLREYEVVLSSSHCVAKGAITTPDQLHISYCHTPMRYAWDLMYDYLKESKLDKGMKGFFTRFFLQYLRSWDIQSSMRVDHFVANSKFVAARIKKFYGREATVIPPPVDLSFYKLHEKKENFYLAASRLVAYKKIDLIVDAFNQMPDKKLVVIGDGPEWKKIKKMAHRNIEILGYQPNSILRDYIQRAKGFVFAALEDFGIIPVEAMGCGTPIIAFGKGGIRETVIDQETGLFFNSQTPAAIREAVENFERLSFDPTICRKRAEEFSLERFNRQYQEFVKEKYSQFLIRNKL